MGGLPPESPPTPRAGDRAAHGWSYRTGDRFEAVRRNRLGDCLDLPELRSSSPRGQSGGRSGDARRPEEELGPSAVRIPPRGFWVDDTAALERGLVPGGGRPFGLATHWR